MTFPTRVHGRYARSVRLDAAGPDALDGYLPTARALDVTRRIINGIAAPDGTRAFSITGPYGSGKSSLAVFLDALLGRIVEGLPQGGRAAHRARPRHGSVAPAGTRLIRGGPARIRASDRHRPSARTGRATVLRALANATKTFRSTATLREQVTDALSRAGR
jgi:hypothetical protein